MKKNDTFLNAQMGDYRLQEILAVGGMSRVYMGFDTRLERRAAVKVLELEQTWVDDTIVQRFEREAKAVAALEHDNIITIYQYGQYEGAYFLAMQYIEGQDLRMVLKDYRKDKALMPVDRALSIMGQVAAALDFAHTKGVIHRDIKPSNVLLTPNDKAILTDFGLVLRPDQDATLGTAFGTPRYIAPEQAVASQQAVGQSDIYALAVIMYEILTGETPFTGETPMEIALAHVSDVAALPSEREASVPKAVDAVMEKALSKDPADRHATAREFVEAIAGAYGKHAPSEPPSAAKTITNEKAKSKKATQPTPVVKSGPAAVPSPIGGEQDSAASSTKERNPLPLLLSGIFIAVVAIAGYFFLQGGGGTPAAGGGGGSAGPGIQLLYNGNALVIHNNTNQPFETFVQGVQGNALIEFVRGEPNADRDDFRGDRVNNEDTIPAGACFKIGLEEEDFVPAQCSRISGQEFLTNPSLFFWRSSATENTFEVYWDDEVIQTCNAIGENERGRCEFPMPTQAEE